jgi:O-antigen/teichoic acid export membrane protein
MPAEIGLLDGEAAGAAKEQPPQAGAARPEKSFLGHALTYGLGAIALQAASAVLVPLYTHCLTTAEFGVLEMLNRIGEVFSICLLANGVRLAAFTFYCQAKDESERHRTAATVLLAPLVVLLGSGLLAAGLAPVLSPLARVDNPALLVFAIVLVMLEGATVVPLVLMQARMESTHYVAVMVAMFFSRIVLTVAVVGGLGWGIWGVLGASGATSAAFGVYLGWREFRRSSFRPDMKILREVLRFCWPFLPAGLCGMVLHNGDRFFLVHFCSLDEVGWYALGYKLVIAVGLLSTDPIRQVWTARMFHAFEQPDAAIVVGRVFTRILAVFLLANMLLCFFDQALIGLIASPGYLRAVTVVDPIAMAYFFWCAANLMDAAFYVRRRTGLKSWVLLASCTVTLALYAALIPPFGALGAAFATLGGMMAHAAFTFVVSQRVFHVRYEFGRLSAMVGLALVLTITAECMEDDPLRLCIKVLLLAAFPAVLWWTGMVTREEKAVVVATCRQGAAWARRGLRARSERRRNTVSPVSPSAVPGDIDRVAGRIGDAIMDRLGAQWGVAIQSCEPERVTLRPYSSVLFFQLRGREWEKRVVAKITAHHPANRRVVEAQNQAVVEYEILSRLSESFRSVEGCSVPRPLLLIPEIEAYVMEFVEGDLLSAHTGAARWLASRTAFEALRRRYWLCGRWLKHLQQTAGVQRGGAEALQGVVQNCEEVLERIAQENGGRCPWPLRDPLLRLVEEQLARVRDGDVPLSGCHGDFGPWNVLAGREGITVIDFLGYRESPLPLDLLGVLAFLDDEACYLTSSARRIAALRASFLQGYGDVCPTAEPVLLICEALQRLRSLATRFMQKPRGLHHRLDWRRIVMKHVAWLTGAHERKLLWPPDSIRPRPPSGAGAREPEGAVSL